MDGGAMGSGMRKDGEDLVISKNKAGHPILFIQSFIQGDLLSGDQVNGDPGATQLSPASPNFHAQSL